MRLVLEAEWSSASDIDPKYQRLKIAGLVAEVFDRGDSWSWSVFQDSDFAPDVAGDWAGNEAQAKKLAEEAIHDYFARKEQ